MLLLCAADRITRGSQRDNPTHVHTHHSQEIQPVAARLAIQSPRFSILNLLLDVNRVLDIAISFFDWRGFFFVVLH